MNLLAFQFTPPDVNLWLILPEIVICVVAVVVMLVDAFGRSSQRWLTGGISLLGILAAAISSVWLWGSSSTISQAFNGRIVLPELRLGLRFGFLLVSAIAALVSVAWVEEDKLPAGEFHSLRMFATAGMMFMASAGDLVIVFRGLEILW